MTLVDVVDVRIMRHRLMATSVAVLVAVAGMLSVRHRMFIPMVFVSRVGVPLVDVVGVPVVLDDGVAAARPMVVSVAGMDAVVGHL
jgi:uncharacterized membrane-anchored protein